MILDDIAEYTKQRVQALKAKKSLYAVRDEAEGRPQGKDFKAALAASGLSVIAELKKASPSKGLIAPDFEQRYLQQAAAYEQGGASAISCLTEPRFFLGSDAYLQSVRQAVELPILRKDFTVDEYQIYEAKNIGADAVLLICSLLSTAQLGEYLAQAHELGLSALVEAHDLDEVQSALAVGAEIIGVNNRNLKDFTVDIHNSERLRELVPENIVFVSESGIKTPEDVGRLYQNKTDAVLIGETLMRSSNKKAELEKLSSMC